MAKTEEPGGTPDRQGQPLSFRGNWSDADNLPVEHVNMIPANGAVVSRIADVLGKVSTVSRIYVDKHGDDLSQVWTVIEKDEEPAFTAVYKAQRSLHREGLHVDYHTVPQEYVEADEFSGPDRIKIYP